MRKAVKAFVTLVIILTVLSTIFLIGRYGWKLWGFRTTEYPDPVPSPAENPTTLEAYATIIGEYYTAFSEGWDAAQVMEAGLNYMVADSHHGNPLAEIGYTVTDLDGDGTDELAIGSMAEDEFFGKIIFSLYTLDENGVPIRQYGTQPLLLCRRNLLCKPGLLRVERELHHNPEIGR